jgi:hypothetical protein
MSEVPLYLDESDVALGGRVAPAPPSTIDLKPTGRCLTRQPRSHASQHNTLQGYLIHKKTPCVCTLMRVMWPLAALLPWVKTRNPLGAP